jgi:hypothetical protein
MLRISWRPPGGDILPISQTIRRIYLNIHVLQGQESDAQRCKPYLSCDIRTIRPPRTSPERYKWLSRVG